MLAEMYNQGKPEHGKKVCYQCFEYYKIETSVNPQYFQQITFQTLGIYVEFPFVAATFTRLHFGFIVLK